MAYNPFSRNAMLATSAPWYNMNQLLRIITDIRKTDYSVLESRRQALEKLNNFPGVDCPYGRNRRFPAGDYFVCELYGDWPRKFQNLRQSLESREQGGSTSEQVSKPGERNRADDSSVSFHQATTNMMDQLVRFDGVMGREEFEEVYGCTWVAVPAGGGGGGGGGGAGP